MKGFAALLSLVAAASASPLTARGSDGQCGAAFHIFPQGPTPGRVGVYTIMNKPDATFPAWHSKKPTISGITHRFGFCHNVAEKDPVTIYNKEIPSGWWTIINHQFYIKPCGDGKITICVEGIQDDLTAVWVGAKAYREFRWSNADIKSVFTETKKRGSKDISFSVNGKKGAWTPVRIIAWNGPSAAMFKVRITGPIDSQGTIGTLACPDTDTARDIYPLPDLKGPGYNRETVKLFPPFPFDLIPEEVEEEGY